MSNAFVAVIGAGAWGMNLVKTLEKMGSLAAVVDPRQGVLDKIRQQYPSLRCYLNCDQDFWNDPAIRALAIATPPETHAGLAIQGLNAGKHVFVEKPMTSSLQDAEALVRVAEESGRTFMVGHLLIYQPAIQFLSAEIQGGRIGKLRSLHQERLNLGRARNVENALWSLGVHDVAVLLHLIGREPELVSFHGQSILNPGVEDDTYLHMKFADSVEAHIHNSWLWPERRRRLTAIGEAGMLVYDELEQRVYWHKKRILADLRNEDLGSECLYEGASEPLKLEMEHFLQCIEKKQEPKSGAKSALEVMRVLERARLA